MLLRVARHQLGLARRQFPSGAQAAAFASAKEGGKEEAGNTRPPNVVAKKKAGGQGTARGKKAEQKLSRAKGKQQGPVGKTAAGQQRRDVEGRRGNWAKKKTGGGEDEVVPYRPSMNILEGNWLPPSMQQQKGGGRPGDRFKLDVDNMFTKGPPVDVIPLVQNEMLNLHLSNPDEWGASELATKYKVKKVRVEAILRLRAIREAHSDRVVQDDSIDHFHDKYFIASNKDTVSEEFWDSKISLKDFAEKRGKDTLQKYLDSYTEPEEPAFLTPRGPQFQVLDELEHEDAVRKPVLKRLASIVKKREESVETVTLEVERKRWKLKYIALDQNK
jgi:hypothetical protein